MLLSIKIDDIETQLGISQNFGKTTRQTLEMIVLGGLVETLARKAHRRLQRPWGSFPTGSSLSQIICTLQYISYVLDGSYPSPPSKAFRFSFHARDKGKLAVKSGRKAMDALFGGSSGCRTGTRTLHFRTVWRQGNEETCCAHSRCSGPIATGMPAQVGLPATTIPGLLQ